MRYKSDVNISDEEIKASLAYMAGLIDRQGDVYWPLIERLDHELVKRQKRANRLKRGHLEERVFWASIEANFIVVSQVRLHRVTHACPQAYFGMILARISGGIRILNRIRLWTVVAHGKRGGGSCSLGWPW